jgi:tellurite resistance protein
MTPIEPPPTATITGATGAGSPIVLNSAPSLGELFLVGLVGGLPGARAILHLGPSDATLKNVPLPLELGFFIRDAGSASHRDRVKERPTNGPRANAGERTPQMDTSKEGPEPQPMTPEVASLLLVMRDLSASCEASQDAARELIMRHFQPASVMQAQMALMMSGLAGGMGEALSQAFGGEEGEAGDSLQDAMDEQIFGVLDAAGREAQTKASALAFKIALLDGKMSDDERDLLDELCERFGLTPAEVRTHAEEHMAVEGAPPTKDLTVEEAGFLFATFIAECDQRRPDLDSPEGQVIRTYFPEGLEMGLMAKMPDEMPTDLPEGVNPLSAAFAPKVMEALAAATEEEKLRALAIGLKLAEADGKVTEDEEQKMRHYCTALGQDLSEVRRWSAANL